VYHLQHHVLGGHAIAPGGQPCTGSTVPERECVAGPACGVVRTAPGRVVVMANTLSLRRRFLAVLGGGFVGTITRDLLSQAIQGWLGKGWPFDILAINLTGALVFALVTVL